MCESRSQKSTAGMQPPFFIDRRMLSSVSSASEVAVAGFITLDMMRISAAEKMWCASQ